MRLMRRHFLGLAVVAVALAGAAPAYAGSVSAAVAANFTKVELWDCNGVGGQQWVPRADGSLFNPQSGRCLDDPQGVTSNQTQLQIYDCNGQWTQVWNLPK